MDALGLVTPQTQFVALWARINGGLHACIIPENSGFTPTTAHWSRENDVFFWETCGAKVAPRCNVTQNLLFLKAG
jgi:hypothetical protein